MRNPWDIKPTKVKRETWSDPSKNHIISNPSKMETTIHGGSKQKEASEKISKFFKWMPGETKSVFPKKGIFLDKNKNQVPDNMERKK